MAYLSGHEGVRDHAPPEGPTSKGGAGQVPPVRTNAPAGTLVDVICVITSETCVLLFSVALSSLP
ncbi:MAG TPA: hypothetical protein VM555_05910, partial [Tahibacter sp.]|nr:hypothetical protein [Tahibacter sp.]